MPVFWLAPEIISERLLLSALGCVEVQRPSPRYWSAIISKQIAVLGYGHFLKLTVQGLGLEATPKEAIGQRPGFPMHGVEHAHVYAARCSYLEIECVKP